jgi:very-short-patch-repair endonuclease
MNRTGDDGELDATWEDARLIVELDGYATHGIRRPFEADRARDRALQVAGWRVVRITRRQLSSDADTIARQLRILLRDTVPGP